jgi:hypothetical protein
MSGDTLLDYSGRFDLARAIKVYSAVLGQELRKLSEGGSDWDFCRTKIKMHQVVCVSAAIARAPRISRCKPNHSSIFQWKAGSTMPVKR